MRGGDAVVLALEKEGVRYISGFSGGGLAPLWPGLRRSSDITAFSTRHEQHGVVIADGYARASGGVGVAMTGTGPGATNTLTGIAGCFADNVPVLLLMGQLASSNLGKEYQQEIPSSIFDDVVKWKGTMVRPEEIPSLMRRAFTALRTGSPGPVVLEMPQDVLTAEIPDDSVQYKAVGSGIKASPDHRAIDSAAALLVSAHLPILNVGGGVLSAGAFDEAKELAEILSMPVASTLVGKSAFPENHPLSLGLGVYPRSRYATGPALHMNRKADVVLSIGTSLRQPHGTDGRAIPDGVKFIHVNADPGDLNKVYQADVSILGDARIVLSDLLKAVKERISGSGGMKEDILADIQNAKSRWLSEWKSTFEDPTSPTNGYRAVQELMNSVDLDNTIAIHDAGGSRGYVSPFWVATRPRNYIGMGGMAAMGWSMGAAIGAKLARPDQLVVHVLGDSSFGMTGMELETAVRMGIPTLTVVLNNGGIGGSLMDMDAPGSPPREVVELGGNWSEVAAALGAHSERVEDPLDISPSITRAIRATEAGKTALVEVMIRPLPTPVLPDNWGI